MGQEIRFVQRPAMTVRKTGHRCRVLRTPAARIATGILFLMLALSPAVFAEGGEGAGGGATREASPRLIFKLRPNSSAPSSLDRVVAGAGVFATEVAPLVRSSPGSSGPSKWTAAAATRGLDRLRVATLPVGADPAVAARRLAGHPSVEYAEVDRPLVSALLPDDPFLHLENSWGQELPDLWGLHKIGAPAAWDLATGRGVLIAVIDTGADLEHPDLASHLWINPGEAPGNGVDDDGNGMVDDVHGWDFMMETPDIVDTNAHGSHVAGIAAAVGDNGEGIAGVAWGADVMVLRTGFVRDSIEAVIYAAANGARVVNMSFGIVGFSPALDEALAAAHESGVVLVAGAGNDGAPVSTFHPASSRYALAVGASHSFDERVSFSNFGNGLDFLAPGVGILSLLSGDNIPSNDIFGGIDPTGRTVGERYMWLSGTSMAAPHVAGLAALVIERHPQSSPEEIRQIFRRSAVDVGPVGWDPENGWGRIDAAAAVAAVPAGAARILTPRPEIFDALVLEVDGIADGGSYRLEAGAGEDPATWSEIGAGFGSAGRQPLASWSLEAVADGAHTLRLRVGSAGGGFYEDRVSVEVDRIVVTEPASLKAFRRGEQIEIRGRIGDPWAGGFLLEYFHEAAGEWRSEGFELTGNGLPPSPGAPGEGMLLATWDTSVVNEAGFYELRLRVERGSLPEVEKRLRVIVDPSLHPGWPRNLTTAASMPRSPLTVVDLDLDGIDEILTATASEVQVVGSDGQPLPGWPRTTRPFGNIAGGPAVGDLDGDGDLELLIGTFDRVVFAWHHDGHSVAGWPRLQAGSRVALADLDGEPGDEVVATEFGSTGVRVLAGDGLLLGFHEVAGALGDGLSAPALGDLDGDGRREVVVRAETRSGVEVHALRADGSSLAGFPVALEDGHSLSHPALGDLDGDGIVEIVVASGTCEVHVLDGGGVERPGWPRPLLPEGARCASPSLADLDLDGRPEIVLGGAEVVTPADRVLRVWDAAGETLPGWPIVISKDVPSSGFTQGFSTAAILDVDGDGRPEVVVDREGSAGPPFAFDAYRLDGSTAPGFSKPVSGDGTRGGNGPAAGDLDGDGLLEVAWMNRLGEVFVWDLATRAGTASVSWGTARSDAGRTGALAPAFEAGCVPSATALCLGGGRFRVEVDWTDFEGGRGTGRSVPLTDDTGSFWFFDPANLELVVKVLDGTPINDRFWVFFGSLSNVAYRLRVTDTETGRSRTYLNPSGTFASRGDTLGFPEPASTSPGAAREPAAEVQASLGASTAREPADTLFSPALAGSCLAGATRQCLLGGRFRVSVSWREPGGDEGPGQSVPLTGDTGAFWFFDPANVELAVKVLDGRPVNGHFWVFFGSLSNVEFTLDVLDTETGESREYVNSQGSFGSRGDTGAFLANASNSLR